MAAGTRCRTTGHFKVSSSAQLFLLTVDESEEGPQYPHASPNAFTILATSLRELPLIRTVVSPSMRSEPPESPRLNETGLPSGVFPTNSGISSL